MPRVFDLIAVVAVAVVLLLPKSSLQAAPALTGRPIELEQIAALEDARYAEPDRVDHAVELAQAYLDLDHPDWALSTLAQFDGVGDYRVQLLQATAQADRLYPAATVEAARRGLEECARAGVRCPPQVPIKLRVISSAMQALVDAKIDPRTDPRRAREAVSHALHQAHAPAPRSQ